MNLKHCFSASMELRVTTLCIFCYPRSGLATGQNSETPACFPIPAKLREEAGLSLQQQSFKVDSGKDFGAEGRQNEDFDAQPEPLKYRIAIGI